jgi:hypothetical protein
MDVQHHEALAVEGPEHANAVELQATDQVVGFAELEHALGT